MFDRLLWSRRLRWLEKNLDRLSPVHREYAEIYIEARDKWRVLPHVAKEISQLYRCARLELREN